VKLFWGYDSAEKECVNTFMIFVDLLQLGSYGGINEIGGNKILLEDKDTRVFLDFGKDFSRRAKFFEEYINSRVANGIEDFLL